MVMHLRAGAAVTDKERLPRKIGPRDGGLAGESMPLRQSGDERFGPHSAGMAIGQFGRAGDEHDVQPVGAKLHHRIARGALGNLHVDAWMVLPVSFDQFGEEAARDESMDADPKPAAFAMCRHAGRLHGAVELIDAADTASTKRLRPL